MTRMMIALVTGLMLAGAGQAAEKKPLKVFVMAGQSNMQGHVNVSTFDSMATDPKTAPILKEMRDADGKPVVCNKVWISSIGCAGDDTTEQTGRLTAGFGAKRECIGPEFTFGIFMEKMLDEPILIIKTSWGGRSLHTNFRPPSAGPYEFCEAEMTGRRNRHKATPGSDNLEKERAKHIQEVGANYRQMIAHVWTVLSDIKRIVPEYDPAQGYEIAGFVWLQGFNDLVSTWTYPNSELPGGYDLYSTLLTHFIRDVRKDLDAPRMPFVIGVMGLNGLNPPRKNETYFRQAQAAPAALPEFKGNVVAVELAPFWDDELDALSKKANRTPEEQIRLKQGTSDLGYHYLGAAKIMAPIGKAFAEAMVDLKNTTAEERR